MNLKTRLSRRIQITDIHEIIFFIQHDDNQKRELYELLFDADDTVAYQAAWVFTHLSVKENEWLYDKQDALIDEALVCRHPGKRRLLLTMLYRQPQANPPRIDFLDFCLERMVSKQEAPGVQSLCIKLAYELCRSIPELLGEYRSILEIMDADLLPVSLRTARKNVLKDKR